MFMKLVVLLRLVSVVFGVMGSSVLFVCIVLIIWCYWFVL